MISWRDFVNETVPDFTMKFHAKNWYVDVNFSKFLNFKQPFRNSQRLLKQKNILSIFQVLMHRHLFALTTFPIGENQNLWDELNLLKIHSTFCHINTIYLRVIIEKGSESWWD